jgi:hypothetical protein
MIPFSEVPFHPEYKQLAAIVGKGKLRHDLWDAWARVVDLHGWRRVLKAADALEPDARWSGQVETLCRAYAKDEADAQQQASKPDPRPRPKDPHESAATFAAVLKRHGLGTNL